MVKKILNRKKVNPSKPTYTGLKKMDEVSLQLFTYTKNEFTEDSNYQLTNFKGFQINDHINWLNIHGLHDIQKIEQICDAINIHDLSIQDILDVNQRPKFQEYNNYLFFTLKSICPSNNSIIEPEHLSFILGNNYLVSFQERKSDYFDHIRKRIRENIGIIRERTSDYLLFLLIESILDNYFKTTNKIEKEIEDMDISDINTDPSPITLKQIELNKRQIHLIKKTLLPIKEFISKIERERFSFIQEKHLKYYYELKDLCLSLIDDCEQIEIRLESHTNLFFSVQGHRMNQVMKTLTVVATIFIPLTFIAGIYGMNFSNMPELNWKWGYGGVWVLMIAILGGMLYYFRKKKWF